MTWRGRLDAPPLTPCPSPHEYMGRGEEDFTAAGDRNEGMLRGEGWERRGESIKGLDERGLPPYGSMTWRGRWTLRPSPLPPLPMSTWGEGREDFTAAGDRNEGMLRGEGWERRGESIKGLDERGLPPYGSMTWRGRWTLRPSPPAPSPHEFVGRGEGRFHRRGG